jgi:septum formation protein
VSDSLILASASPRRAEILNQMGAPFVQWSPEVTELTSSAEGPAALVLANAVLKAQAGSRQHPGRWVLAADTIVVIDGDVLGKPETQEMAWQMLARLSGRQHDVYTGVALCREIDGNNVWELREVEASKVYFKPLNQQAIRAYCELVNPLDKAGAYGIQEHGERIIDKWEGSFSNIMGLPAELLEPHLRRLGCIR